MRTWRATKGTKVLSKTSAEKVGTIDRLVIDVAGRRIAAVQVAKGQVVDWEAISGLGDDAVIIEDESRIRHAADGREERTLNGELDLAGRRLLSDQGDELGTVEDVEFDEQTGVIEAILTKDGRHAGDRLLAIGSYCAVVANERGPAHR